MNEATKLYSYDGILPFFFFWYLLELIELLLMLQSLLQVSSVSQEVFPESRDQSFFCPQSPVSLSVTVPHPSSVCSLIASGVFQEPPVARPASPQWAEAGGLRSAVPSLCRPGGPESSTTAPCRDGRARLVSSPAWGGQPVSLRALPADASVTAAVGPGKPHKGV